MLIIFALFFLTALVIIFALSKIKIPQKNGINFIARAAAIATIYTLITFTFKPLSYGPVQVRLSEALTLLPLLESAAIPGLFIGCLVSNILGGLGLWDIFFGSSITLVAAYLTAKMPGPLLGSLPPIILNALGVSYYLSMIYHVPYWITSIYIGIGQVLSVAGLGIPLFYLIQRTKLKDFFKKD